MAANIDIEPRIVVRGDVPDAMVAYAREKIRAVAASIEAPVLAYDIRLDHHRDPARNRPNHVELTIDIDGVAVRAHRNGVTMAEAIDGAIARLERSIDAVTERARSRHFRHRDPAAWHHGDPSADRPSFYPRPSDERAVVRRKTFAAKPESIEDALFDLERLDHDFFLFVHDETGRDAVVYRVDGGYGLVQRVPTPDASARAEVVLHMGPPPSVMSMRDAITALDESHAPFVFFVEPATDRGLIVYRRYDGHYGLITPN